MSPGLVVKLRPAGPWRCGPDTGARNRVDFTYHSDTLYGAVCAAMARLGELDAWLEATARNPRGPAVCFSSLFPFQEEIRFITPPRTLWPPPAASLKVRWKSARFVPLDLMRELLAGKPPNEDHWSVDGASECLVPAGHAGPFRMGLRWNSAVDRLSGAAERHATACLEFRPGAGWWAAISFADDAARERWSAPVRAAMRILADSGFGGERSRGWGHAEEPEFAEGTLPDLILPAASAESQPPAPAEPAELSPASSPQPRVPAESPAARSAPASEAPQPPSPVPGPLSPAGEGAPAPDSELSPAPGAPPPAPEPASEETPPPSPVPSPLSPAGEGAPAPDSDLSPAPESASEEAPPPAPVPSPLSPADEGAPAPEAVQPPSPFPSPLSTAVSYWLLSLFVPAGADVVDWARGNYFVVTRGGRIDSPVRSGELKKELQMVGEGSVVVAGEWLRGAAPDVAPDGFAHPVYRSGFALAIPLPGQVGA